MRVGNNCGGSVGTGCRNSRRCVGRFDLQTWSTTTLWCASCCVCSIMLAAKFFDDQYFNNAYYGKVGGVPCSGMACVHCCPILVRCPWASQTYHHRLRDYVRNQLSRNRISLHGELQPLRHWLAVRTVLHRAVSNNILTWGDIHPALARHFVAHTSCCNLSPAATTVSCAFGGRPPPRWTLGPA